MSGTRRPPARAQLPLLDRLADEAPERAQDAAPSAAEAMAALRRSVRRDVEALLNARRRWRSWPRGLGELAASPLGFGVPDCNGAALHDERERESLRREIEDTLRRFEPRLRTVEVRLAGHGEAGTDTTLRLRIEAMLHAEPAPEPLAFDTTVDLATSAVLVRAADDV